MEVPAMKSFVRLSALVAAIFLVCAISLPAASSIPAGTVLPVRLDSTLSSVTSHAGQPITARVMQRVPLEGGSSIPAGAKVIGHIVDVSASAASVSVVFDTLETRGERILLTTDVRAIASFVAVEDAQLPDTGDDRGSPETAWTTIQVGGDSVYRGGGHVEGANGVVGEPVAGGVLSHIYANEQGGCRGPINAHDSLQALWVFSSNACGAYGFPNLEIRHTGRTAPAGQITFNSTTGPVKIERGAGLLLRVNATSVSGA
jgi:hypothetical protein